MALLNTLEQEELTGGLRSLPLRVLPALLTSALLLLAGDMLGAWPLSWFALVPLSFACRGAGPIGALLLAGTCFSIAAVTQSYWLLDVADVNAPLVWMQAGILPALPFAAIELPACRKIPWALRPLIVGVLAVGFYSLLTGYAAMLIPGGGLIDSGLLMWLFPKLGLSTLGGMLTAIAWSAGEMFYTPRLKMPRRRSWPGVAFAIALVVVAGIDFLGVSLKNDGVRTRDFVLVTVVPESSDPVAASEAVLPANRPAGVVVWHAIDAPDAVARNHWQARAGEFAERRQAVVVMLLSGPDALHGYIFRRTRLAEGRKTWQSNQHGEPLVIDGVSTLSLYPSLHPDAHWSTLWSMEIYVTPELPVHDAQRRYWLREQRRGAMIRGSRQICVWPGNGSAIDGNGRVIAQSEHGEAFQVLLPVIDITGEAMGHPRLQVIETILALSAPVLAAMLVLLTPVAWAKRRYFARRNSPQGLAIEEVFDDETNLTKEQTDTITRSFKREDLRDL